MKTRTAQARKRDPAPPADRPPPNPRFDLHAAKAARKAEARPAQEPAVLSAGTNLSSDPRLVKLIEQHCELVERGKALLDEADVVLDSILTLRGNVSVVSMDAGRVGLITDQFLDNNVIWRSHSCRRFCVSIIGGPKASQRPPPAR